MDSDLTTVDNQQVAITALPESLQQRVLEASNRLKESSSVQVNKIRNDAKNFILPDGEEVDSFTGIIIAVKHANMHYAMAYEEGVTNPPDCLAVMEDANDVACADLKPHRVVESPYSAACGHCAKLQWGSDKGGKGKGKECAEYVMLAIYIPSLGDDLFLLECKKGNSKTADSYLANVTSRFGHPIVAHTLFSMGKKAKWAQSFNTTTPVSAELVAALAERIDEANSMLVERVKGAYRTSDNTPGKVETDKSSGRAARSR